VRTSDQKFRTPKDTSPYSYSQALDKLITQHILPMAKMSPWQDFRDEELWTLDVNDVLEANLKNLEKIYNKYILAVKKYITLEDIHSIVNLHGQMEVPLEILKYCFAMSKMTVTDESKDYKKYF
jgi:hypothetical protein